MTRHIIKGIALAAYIGGLASLHPAAAVAGLGALVLAMMRARDVIVVLESDNHEADAAAPRTFIGAKHVVHSNN
ncbi:MAG: hypothetical protein LLG00_05015 [Planctomycetaceae bacterium]|nr:hypothetical protein [Planctomycetaceae bacterium]